MNNLDDLLQEPIKKITNDSDKIHDLIKRGREIRKQVHMTVRQIEQAHKNAANSRLKFKGHIAGEIEYPGEIFDV